MNIIDKKEHARICYINYQLGKTIRIIHCVTIAKRAYELK